MKLLSGRAVGVSVLPSVSRDSHRNQFRDQLYPTPTRMSCLEVADKRNIMRHYCLSMRCYLFDALERTSVGVGGALIDEPRRRRIDGSRRAINFNCFLQAALWSAPDCRSFANAQVRVLGIFFCSCFWLEGRSHENFNLSKIV